MTDVAAVVRIFCVFVKYVRVLYNAVMVCCLYLCIQQTKYIIGGYTQK